MATNAERAAKIREATLQAVRERNQLGDAAIEQLVTIYDDAGEAIAEQIQRVSGGGDNLLTLDNLQQILTEVRKQMAELEKQRDGLLYRKIGEAALLGTKPFSGELPPSQLFAINHQAVSFVRALVAADGLQLSDRLWRLNRYATATLAEHIQFAVINGESAHQAMLRTMGSGQGVPHDVAMAYNGAKAGTLSRKVRSLMTGEADPVNGKGVVYQAERVFRTEINRAHGEAYMASAFQTDGVAGVRFMLSVNHRVRDVCDTHATADKYGLGPGVYPNREACPWPAHPNTLSYVEVVFDWEVKQRGKPTDPAPPAPPADTPAANPVPASKPSREPGPTPKTLDDMIAAGRAQADRFLADGIDGTYLQRLHAQVNQVRSTMTPAKVANRGKASELVQAASMMFPDDWTQEADKLGPLFTKASDARGFHITLYNPDRRVKITGWGVLQDLEPGSGFIRAGNFSTALHEYTHRLQHALPELDNFFQDLHHRRTRNDPLRRLRDLTGHNYAPHEVAREDHYVNPYQGRIYNYAGMAYTGRHGALEVMTMAFEDVLGGYRSRLVRLVENDREMFDLVMGLLHYYVPS